MFKIKIEATISVFYLHRGDDYRIIFTSRRLSRILFTSWRRFRYFIYIKVTKSVFYLHRGDDFRISFTSRRTISVFYLHRGDNFHILFKSMRQFPSLSPDPFFASLFSFLFVRDTNLAHPIKNCSLHSLV